MRSLRRSALLAAGCALALAPSVQAAKGSKTVTRGGVSATLTWTTSGDSIVATDPHLRIVRHGVQLLDRDLGTLCELCNGVGDPRHAVHVRNVDGNAELEVLVDLYTGGAHCCSTTPIFSFARAAYFAHLASWGNGSYRLLDLDHDGRPEFVSTDDRFAYAFAAYAFSWRPPQVFDFAARKLVDRTRRFPGHVRADLKDIDATLSGAGSGDDLRGAIAARVADLYLLGRGREAGGYLAAALKRGHLAGDSAWPAGKKYKPALLKFLRKLGYR